jgi:TfoX/Sxy family transcriptional regulator of competence genes
MSVSEELTNRIRALVATDPRVTEKKMFGGICFLLDGKILVSSRRTGTMLVQCGAESAAEVTKEPGVAPMIMKGRPSANFIDVDGDRLDTDEELQRWIDLAERFVRTKPG